MAGTIGDPPESDKCRLLRAAMQFAQKLHGLAAKKRLHSRRVEPDDWTEVQNQSDGRLAREEDTPSAGWAFAEGGGFSASPVSKDRGRGRRIRTGSTSTLRIWPRARASAMRPTTCQLCVPCRERAVVLTKNNGPARGEERGQGPRDTLAPVGREQIGGAREERSAVMTGHLVNRPSAGKAMIGQISHASSA